MYWTLAAVPVCIAHWSHVMIRRRRWRERMVSIALVAMLLIFGMQIAARVHVSGGMQGVQTLVFRDVELPAIEEPAAVRQQDSETRRSARTVLDRTLLNDAADIARLESGDRARPSIELQSRLAIGEGPRLRTPAGVLRSHEAKKPRAGIGLVQSQQDIDRRHLNVQKVEHPVPLSVDPQEPVDNDADPDSLTLEVEAIMEWMRLTASELPPGIKQHVQPKSGDLTARATFTQAGAIYEIFLMARLALHEVHVVLVREGETYYLIDRSFQREGTSFRVGSARRSAGIITGVVSEERAAASPEALRFYRVFLGWWDKERLKL